MILMIIMTGHHSESHAAHLCEFTAQARAHERRASEECTDSGITIMMPYRYLCLPMQGTVPPSRACLPTGCRDWQFLNYSV